MADVTGLSSEVPERTPDHSSSRRWLYAAIVVTFAASIVVGGMLAGLGRMPGNETDVGIMQPPDSGTALTVAVARTPGGPTEWSNWARIIKYVSEQVGRPVSVRYLSEEEVAADVIASTDVDVAFVCAHHYLDLRDSGEVVGLCTPVLDGGTTGRMLLIVRADDPAETFDDLQGSPVAVSDKSSLGGYAYLQYLAQQHGVEMVEFFTDVRLGDTQEANMREVLDGSARATVVSSVQVLAWDMNQFKVIEESPLVGSPPIVVDEDMPADLREEILDIFVNMDTSTVLPEGTNIEGFKPLNDSDYEFAEELRRACGHHAHP